MLQNNNDIVILTDEKGRDVRFKLLDLIEYESKEYVVLYPLDDNSQQVSILEVEKSAGGKESYISVDDDDTVLKVYEIFKERFKHKFQFAD